MPYASLTDILTRYPPITTMIGSSEQDVTSAQVTSVYLADAESFVNGYVGAKYATPLAAEPMITMLTCDLAIFKMVEDKAPRTPELAEKRYERAIDTLEKLRDGKMVLSPSQTILVGAGGDNYAWSSVSSFHPVFSPVLSELDQKVDCDFVTSERGNRSDDV
jgi:phage gp36-like protein